MELPFDDWLAGNGSSPWSITFPQYMRLSQEQPRKSPKTKPLKTAIRVTKLARRYEVSIALSSFYMTSRQLLYDSLLTLNIWWIYTAAPVRAQLKGPEDATSKGRGGEWRGGWGTTGRPWEYSVWCMRPKLWWFLDLLWPVREMVPWQVREDHPSQSGTHQAVQVPLLHRQQEGQGLSLGNPNGQL